MLRVLHTADWHLGKALFSERLEGVQALFLQWLLEELNSVDVLLVAGDIFDSQLPSFQAQRLYYDFLAKLAKTACRHMVIVAGNHDSVAFLNASRGLLLGVNVHVVAGADLDQEVLTLCGENGEAELIVCAVPFLREGDLLGGSVQALEGALQEGVSQHYQAVYEAALLERRRVGGDVPIVAMGHLFTQFAVSDEGEAVRDLYVGASGHVGVEALDIGFDYVALGHLHRAQMVAGRNHVRYSGSPVALSFTEALYDKKVLRVDFEVCVPMVREVCVPVWQGLFLLKGDWEAIDAGFSALDREKIDGGWLEVVYEGAWFPELRARVEGRALALGLRLLCLRVRSLPFEEEGFEALGHYSALSPSSVFDWVLRKRGIEGDDARMLRVAFSGLLQELENED